MRIPIWKFVNGVQKNWYDYKVEHLNMYPCSMKCIVGIQYSIILSLMQISLGLKTVILAFLVEQLTCCTWIFTIPVCVCNSWFTIFGLLSCCEVLIIRMISLVKHSAEAIGELFLCTVQSATNRLYSTQRILEFEVWDMNLLVGWYFSARFILYELC